MATNLRFILFATAIQFALVNSIIIPVEYKRGKIRCNNKPNFKGVIPECEYSERDGLVTRVAIGQAGSNQYHLVSLLVDTGSPITWIANSNTQVVSTAHNNTAISWQQFLGGQALLYDFQIENRAIRYYLEYDDYDAVKVTQYTNQVLIMREQGTTGSHLVNMSLYLATTYYTTVKATQTSGILGLSFALHHLHLPDTSNVFLQQYEQVPGYMRMISFDLNWHYESQTPLPSCFGIGQSVSAFNQQRSITLKADAFDKWKITIYSIQVNFTNTKRSYSLQQTISDLDTGTSGIWFPEDFVMGFHNPLEKVPFIRKNRKFPCSALIDILPEILFTFHGTDGRQLEFRFAKELLYQHDAGNSKYCTSLLDVYSSMSLGLPFFSAAYIEMYWDQLYNGQVKLGHKYHSFV